MQPGDNGVGVAGALPPFGPWVILPPLTFCLYWILKYLLVAGVSWPNMNAKARTLKNVRRAETNWHRRRQRS